MAGKAKANTVLFKNCDADTAIEFNIIQPEGGVIKSATLLLNTEMKWYCKTGRDEISEAIGFYASIIIGGKKFVGTNTILQIDCYKIIKGELIEYREGQNYIRRKGTFEKIRIDKFGFVTFL